MPKDNPYLDQINKVLPRLLALYDRNAISRTLGYGDRFYWAWKLIDFNNATFQGAAHGLARLIQSGLLNSELDKDRIIKRIMQMALSVKSICDANGSVCEAFPNESSFCVTALLAYDLLTAVELLENTLEKEQSNAIIDVVRPLIQFILKHDEHHGIISNHLATAVVALFKYHSLTGEETCARGQYFLNKILANQSEEGWYKEYDGADPGYQSLCTYYLADLHRLRPDLNLLESLRKSIQFIQYFAHPDGSFGGVYGSRNTRFYYPAGMELLRHEIPEAAALADFMRHSIQNHTTVTLETMDEPNLIPMFNAYCMAAALHQSEKMDGHNTMLLETSPPDFALGCDDVELLIPCQKDDLGLINFPKAGIIIQGNVFHYTIISTHKGGVCYSFPKSKAENTLIDTGVVYKDSQGKMYSNQTFQMNNAVSFEKNVVQITAPLIQVQQPLPSAGKFAILRMLSLTLMRNQFLLNTIKKTLVWLLINRKKKSKMTHIRRIQLGNQIIISDETKDLPHPFVKLALDMPFSVMHMASQGYWQKQDDTL